MGAHPSFRCTYEIKNYADTQIINDRDKEDLYNINAEIRAKIKILNGKKKEPLIFKKRFNKLGLNTIDFIIEGKLTNTSFMFNNCSSLKKIEFLSFDTSQVVNMSKYVSKL